MSAALPPDLDAVLVAMRLDLGPCVAWRQVQALGAGKGVHKVVGGVAQVRAAESTGAVGGRVCVQGGFQRKMSHRAARYGSRGQRSDLRPLSGWRPRMAVPVTSEEKALERFYGTWAAVGTWKRRPQAVCGLGAALARVHPPQHALPEGLWGAGCGVLVPEALQFRRARAQAFTCSAPKGRPWLEPAMAKELEELAEQVVRKHNEAGAVSWSSKG